MGQIRVEIVFDETSGTEVLLPTGVSVGGLREEMAGVLGRFPEALARMWVDGLAVTAEMIVGQMPLLPGATLTTAPHPCTPLAAAHRVGLWATKPQQPESAWNAALPRAGLRTQLLSALLPVAAAAMIAVILGQPTLLVFSAVGLVGVLPGMLAGRRRQARTASSQDGRAPGSLASGLGQWCLESLTGGRNFGDGQDHGDTHTFHDSRPIPLGFASETAASPDAQMTAPPTLHLPDRALAIVGPLAAARSHAQLLALGLAVTSDSVAFIGRHRVSWRLLRWLPSFTAWYSDSAPLAVDARSRADCKNAVLLSAESPAIADMGDGSLLVVDSPSEAELSAAASALQRGATVLLVLPEGVTPPGWCRDVRAPDPAQMVSSRWSEMTARRLAAAKSVSGAHHVGHGSEVSSPNLMAGNWPEMVSLLDLLPARPATEPRTVPQLDWQVPLGVDGAGRLVSFDLLADGPHLLVAGTTGSGKSELLQSLVLALAATHSPGELSLALIDFKGGATFGPCLDLPHVCGQVTDLDAGLAERALVGLQAELRRRKSVLASRGVASFEALPPGTLPRLVVVIDEYRALADDLPDLVTGFIRLSAQGRSLGLHLVLATQRPAGSVGAEMRANFSTRISLRVVDPADSMDVIDSPLAAQLPASAPGRAWMRRAGGELVAFQGALASAPRNERARVELAPEFGGLPAETGLAHVNDGPLPSGLSEVLEHCQSWGVVARQPPVWLPPLPTSLAPRQVATGGSGFLLGLADLPEQQAQVPLCWNPDQGHLAIVGHRRSGRTNTMTLLAQEAAAAGWEVVWLDRGSDPSVIEQSLETSVDDSCETSRHRRTAVASLGRQADPPLGRESVRRLFLIEDLVQLREAWHTLTSDPVKELLGAGPEVAVAATSASSSLGGLGHLFGPRLVLGSGDAATDMMNGIPRELAGQRPNPGRGVWLGDIECHWDLTARAAACQTVLARSDSRMALL